MKIGETDEPQPVVGFSQPETLPNTPPEKTFNQQHTETQHWSNKSYQRPSKRPIYILLTILLAVGGGLGYWYFTTGSLPAKLDEASPLLLEQQRKLDAKVSRLLDAIESMPTLRRNPEKSNDSAATASPAASNTKPDTSAIIAKGQILRK